MRVDATAEGAVYEVIAGPQEQRGQVQQENCEHPAQGPVDPGAEQQTQDKPGAQPINLNYDYIYILLVHYV